MLYMNIHKTNIKKTKQNKKQKKTKKKQQQQQKKIHKPTITGAPIISGCDGPTFRWYITATNIKNTEIIP